MAGSDRTGPGSARADLFDARPWFLVGEPEATAEAAGFVRSLGATPVFMTDDGTAHDSMMAAVSHLPQVVASALMARVGESVGRDGLAYAGSGLRDATRLAGSQSSVWESVLATNADALQPLLQELAGDLERIAGQLQDRTGRATSIRTGQSVSAGAVVVRNQGPGTRIGWRVFRAGGLGEIGRKR